MEMLGFLFPASCLMAFVWSGGKHLLFHKNVEFLLGLMQPTSKGVQRPSMLDHLGRAPGGVRQVYSLPLPKLVSPAWASATLYGRSKLLLANAPMASLSVTLRTPHSPTPTPIPFLNFL